MRSFNLKILTADGVRYDGEAQGVLVRTVVGDTSVWAGHIDLVTAIGTGRAMVTVDENNKRYACCSGGVMSVVKDKVTVLANSFEWKEDIDVDRAKASLEKGEKELERASDKREQELAKIRIRRAKARLEVASLQD